MEIDKELYNEIKAYCDFNNIKTRDYIHALLKKAFMEDKYGKIPPALAKKDEKGTSDEKAIETIVEFANKIVENNAGLDELLEESGITITNEMIDECIWAPDEIKPIKKEVKPIKSKKTKL